MGAKNCPLGRNGLIIDVKIQTVLCCLGRIKRFIYPSMGDIHSLIHKIELFAWCWNDAENETSEPCPPDVQDWLVPVLEAGQDEKVVVLKDDGLVVPPPVEHPGGLLVQHLVVPVGEQVSAQSKCKRSTEVAT